MPIPEPKPRSAAHTRKVTYCGWRRDDGLWDIEGELLDLKEAEWASRDKGLQPPGAVHHMKVRICVDETLTVIEAHADMPETPFAECLPATSPVQRLVGQKLARGWRKAIDHAMGGTLGCTHLRELLQGLGTAAYQTVAPTRNIGADPTQPPRHLGQCISWDFSGPVMKRHLPEFYRRARTDSDSMLQKSDIQTLFNHSEIAVADPVANAGNSGPHDQ
jgi:hypothetical protein